jgi:hypothetical protein
METPNSPQANTDAPVSNGPRLVLISAEGPDESTAASPNEILGSEQRVAGSGGFCLTDR